MESAAKGLNCLSRNVHPSVAFEIIQSDAGLCTDTSEDYKIQAGRMECMGLCGIYKVFVSVYFASEGQTVMVQGVTITKMSLLFNDESDNGHYDEVFPVGKEKRNETF